MTSSFSLGQDVTLRQARLKDLGSLQELVRQYYAFDEIDFCSKAITAGLRELLGEGELGLALLLETETGPVGYAVVTFGFDLEFGGRQATLTDLFIQSRYRGRGLGQATLSCLELILANLGVRALELQVVRANPKALSFYQKIGFQAHDRIPMSKTIGSKRKK